MVANTRQSPADFINKLCGNVAFTFYTYVDTFKQKPVDMDDLVDGLLYIEGKNYLKEESYRKQRAEMESKGHK
jgi:hypothetical protein